MHGDRIKVAVTSPPVDGAANDAVVELFARSCGVARREVSIASGHGSRRKTVHVGGASAAAIEELLR